MPTDLNEVVNGLRGTRSRPGTARCRATCAIELVRCRRLQWRPAGGSVFQSWSLLLNGVGAENSLPAAIISFVEDDGDDNDDDADAPAAPPSVMMMTMIMPTTLAGLCCRYGRGTSSQIAALSFVKSVFRVVEPLTPAPTVPSGRSVRLTVWRGLLRWMPVRPAVGSTDTIRQSVGVARAFAIVE